MTGKISEDGNSFTGGWTPKKGKESPENPPYDFVLTRLKETTSSLPSGNK